MRYWLAGLFWIVLGTSSVWAQSSYEEGLVLLYHGNYQAATEKFKQDLHQFPGRPETYFGLGVCFFKLEQYKDAHQAYHNALKFVPEPQLSSRVRSGLGDLYFEMGQFSQAIQEYQKALTFEKNWHGARFKLAQAYLKESQYRNALNEAQYLIKHQPQFLPPLKLAGESAIRLNDYPMAQAYYQNYLSKMTEPDFDASQQLIALYRHEGLYPESVKEAHRLYQQYPHQPEVALIYGDSLLEMFYACSLQKVCQSYLDDSRDIYQRLVLQNPSEAGFARLAQTYKLDQDFLKAAYFYHKAAVEQPQSTYHLRALEMYFVAGDKEAYERTFETLPPEIKSKFQGIAPQKAFQNLLGNSLLSDYAKGQKMLKAHQSNWAKTLFLQARQSHADDWRPYFGLSQIYLQEGRLPEASGALRLAHLHHPASRELISQLANVYQKLNQKDALISLYKQALRTYPNSLNYQKEYLKWSQNP